jgi:hypothetical protein
MAAGFNPAKWLEVAGVEPRVLRWLREQYDEATKHQEEGAAQEHFQLTGQLLGKVGRSEVAGQLVYGHHSPLCCFCHSVQDPPIAANLGSSCPALQLLWPKLKFGCRYLCCLPPCFCVCYFDRMPCRTPPWPTMATSPTFSQRMGRHGTSSHNCAKWTQR